LIINGFAALIFIQVYLVVLIISVRDIPMPLVSSGVEHGNLRELALARMKDLGTQVTFTTLTFKNNSKINIKDKTNF